MEQHSYKVGDRVEVMNSTLGGKIISEGFATVRRLLKDKDRYLVQFDDEAEKFERYVAPCESGVE